MTTEARELYCYVTGSEPFANVMKHVDNPKLIREIVDIASWKYGKDFCTNGESCFSDEDIVEVCTCIYQEKGIKAGRGVCDGCKYFHACSDIARKEKCDGYERANNE